MCMILLENKGIISLNAKKTSMAQVKSATQSRHKLQPRIAVAFDKQAATRGERNHQLKIITPDKPERPLSHPIPSAPTSTVRISHPSQFEVKSRAKFNLCSFGRGAFSFASLAHILQILILMQKPKVSWHAAGGARAGSSGNTQWANAEQKVTPLHMAAPGWRLMTLD